MELKLERDESSCKARCYKPERGQSPEVTPWLPLRGQALHRLRLEEPTDVSPWSFRIFRLFSRRSSGFSLIELLAVIAIIGILAGFIVPALFKARARARQAVCVVQLRQLALAVRAYSDDFEGVFPTSLYSTTFAHYYGNESAITLCPDETRDLSSGIPRGSYGLADLSSYRLTNIPEISPLTGHPVVIIADSTDEDLTEANFSARHRGAGNIGFLDGHVEAKSAAEAADYI